MFGLRSVRAHPRGAPAGARAHPGAEIGSLTERIRQYDRKLETVSEECYPETALLRQVEGIGLLTALAFVLTVEDPSRFEKSRSVGAYLGLVPATDRSGESDPHKRISKEGDEMLRKLLVGSAHYVLGPFGSDTDLRRHGEKIASRGGKNAKKRAAVAVGRKLAVLLHHLRVTGVVYTQMTKTNVLAARIGGNHVPDLDVVVGDDYPVDQKLHQPTPLLEGGVVESRSHPIAEILHGTRHAG